ncbi:MAG: Membrane-bound lytic murein transglycosylase D precursor [Bacteroidetes bacterium ADurb.Bin408]|nr:MAG: Membrane-bound lytic murein transglycosylase D precursor [Bacteroidetes bacterium ADurb.Bin408]
MKLKCIFFLQLLVFTSFIAKARPNTDSIKDPDTTDINDDLIVSRLDDLAASMLFKGKMFYADTASLNVFKYKPDEIPQFTEEKYKASIKKMNINSPFPYVYNEDVRKFIELYVYKKRGLTSRLLGLAAYYFPLFEETLDKYNLPLELKYLAVIESALNPTAISRAGAAGLWQFMFNTGKLYGLEVSSYVDDRYDPYKATIAACEHFVDLYKIYNDWALVLAAYNAGAGNVNKAIRRAGGEMDYWTVRKYMPRETQSYVPVFIAASYVLSHASEHNLYPVYPEYLYIKTDTITVSEKITFEQLSEALNIPMDEIISLNPTFKKYVVPASLEKNYVVKLPYDKIGEFIANEKEIYSFKTLEQLIKEDYMARNNIKPVYTESHTVRKGESLGVISRKYGCTISELQKWNRLKGTAIHPGQKLIVTQEKPEIILPKPPQNTIKEFYTVEKNDNLRNIAQKYSCTVDNIRLWNSIKNLNITPGQQLVIHIPVLEPVKELNMLETQAAIEQQIDTTLTLASPVTAKTAEPPHTTVAVEVQTPADTVHTELAGQIPSPKSNTENNPKYIYHTVQKGDTLWNIAQRYESVTVEDIKKLNSLKDNNLRLGQKLKLPVKDKS